MERSILSRPKVWARSRSFRIVAASGLGIAAVLAWVGLLARSTGISVTPARGRVPAGEVVLSIQLSPYQADGKGGLIPGSGGAWMLDPRSGSIRRRGGALIEQSRISPDGRWIVYRDDRFLTWIEPLGGGDRRQVPIDTGRAVWSPDSRSIVASDYRNASTKSQSRRQFLGHFRFRIDDPKPERLPFPDSEIIEDWSPDDRWIVTIPLDGGKAMLRSVDGRSRRPVSPDPRSWGHRFSPDGRALAFLRRGPSPSPGAGALPAELCLIDVQGAGIRVLRGDLDQPQFLSWSPDGSAILVGQHHAIAIVRLDGEFLPIAISVRRPFDLSNLPASFNPDPLYIGTAEWAPPPAVRKR